MPIRTGKARVFCRVSSSVTVFLFLLIILPPALADTGGQKSTDNPNPPVTAVEKLSGDGSGYRLAVEYVYDAYGHLIQVRNAQEQSIVYWQATASDAYGHITAATLGNGLITQKTYDPATGQLQAITTGRSGNPTGIQNLAYAWDAVGNLTQRQDLNRSLTESFSYDELNRLRQTALNSEVTDALSYDALGNIQQKTVSGVPTTYVYDLAGAAGPHAVTALKDAGGSTTAIYTYDANGNLISGKGRSVIWNAANYPTAITQGTHTTEFTYGPDRQRITQSEYQNGSLQRTTTSVGNRFEQTTDASGQTAYRHFIRAGGQTIAIHTRTSDYTQETTYPLRDHLGSVSTLTNEDGDVIADLSFDAFGNRRDPTDWSGPVVNPAPDTTDRGYTGHKMLDGVALIHMNGRVYDPAIGRFLSADPIIQAPFNSQSFNRYSYVWNNPLSAIDPSGFLMNFAEEEPFKLPDMTVDGGSEEYWRNYWNMWWWSTFGMPHGQQVREATRFAHWAVYRSNQQIHDSRHDDFVSDAYDFFTEDAFDAIKKSFAGDLSGVGISAAFAIVKPLKVIKNSLKVAEEITPTAKQLEKFRKQLDEHGPESLERSRRSIEQRLKEHLEKLEEIKSSGGHTSSVEREIRNFERELEAIRQTFGDGS